MRGRTAIELSRGGQCTILVSGGDETRCSMSCCPYCLEAFCWAWDIASGGFGEDRFRFG